MVNNNEQSELNDSEFDIGEQEQEENKSLLQTAINEVAKELGISEEEAKEALGELENVIPRVDPATVTDLYNQTEEALWGIRLQEVNTERQLDDDGLDELRQNLLEFRRSIQIDRTYQMDITRMINAVKLRSSQINIPGLDGLSQGGPSLDELQRITDGFRRNEPPKLTLSGSTIDHNDDDDVLQAALNKHFSK